MKNVHNEKNYSYFLKSCTKMNLSCNFTFYELSEVLLYNNVLLPFFQWFLGMSYHIMAYRTGRLLHHQSQLRTDEGAGAVA